MNVQVTMYSRLREIANANPNPETGKRYMPIQLERMTGISRQTWTRWYRAHVPIKLADPVVMWWIGKIFGIEWYEAVRIEVVEES